MGCGKEWDRNWVIGYVAQLLWKWIKATGNKSYVDRPRKREKKQEQVKSKISDRGVKERQE